MILIIHLCFAGIWLGCVLTEALFERALLGTGRDNESILASLHKRVDMIVEIPAFLGVLITGAILLSDAGVTTWLIVKVVISLVAVVANIYCVRLVFLRVKYASEKNWVAFERADHMQHKIGAVVLLGIVLALSMGLYFSA